MLEVTSDELYVPCRSALSCELRLRRNVVRRSINTCSSNVNIDPYIDEAL